MDSRYEHIMGPKQNGCHFADDIVFFIFLNENCCNLLFSFDCTEICSQRSDKSMCEVPVFGVCSTRHRSLFEPEFLSQGCILGKKFYPRVYFSFSVLLAKGIFWNVLSKGILGLKFLNMMTSSNGNIFHVNVSLCVEFTGHRWIPLTKASDAELWCFLWSAPE